MYSDTSPYKVSEYSLPFLTLFSLPCLHSSPSFPTPKVYNLPYLPIHSTLTAFTIYLPTSFPPHCLVAFISQICIILRRRRRCCCCCRLISSFGSNGKIKYLFNGGEEEDSGAQFEKENQTLINRRRHHYGPIELKNEISTQVHHYQTSCLPTDIGTQVLG